MLESIKEIYYGFKLFRLSILLAYFDVIQRYKRSTLGQFWITITTAVLTIGMTAIFSSIFGLEPRFYLLYIVPNFILWILIRDTLIESCNAFINSKTYLDNGKWNLFIFTNRVVIKNIYIYLHNLIILILIIPYAKPHFSISGLLFYFSNFVILIFILMGLSMIIAIVATRYRDLRMIIENILQLVFFITPIMWIAEMIKGKSAIFLNYNIFAITLSAVNDSFIYGTKNFFGSYVLIISAILVWLINIIIFKSNKSKVTMWL